MHLGLALVTRRCGGDDRRVEIAIDINHLAGGAGLGISLGNNKGHRFADIAHRVAGQHRAFGHHRVRAIAVLQLHQTWHMVGIGLVEIGAGQHHQDAGHCLGGVHINCIDAPGGKC